MNHALNRTRRNMIAVSVGLALIYALGWKFPADIRVFGNSFSANPDSINLLAWIVLTYLSYEYFVQLIGKTSDELRVRWRTRFIESHRKVILSRMTHTWTSDAYINAHGTDWLQKGFLYSGTINRIKLDAGARRLFSQDIAVEVIFDGEIDGTPTILSLNEQETFRTNYFRSLDKTIATWFVLLASDSHFFEHLMPIIFPAIAIFSYLLGPVPFFVESSAISDPGNCNIRNCW